MACHGTISYSSVNAFVCVSTDSGVFCREEQWSSVSRGVWAGLWLDSLCGRQNSMNQTLIVSSPQETIRCLTNHVSVFLPTPSPFTQLCSLINVWWKWWETDGHSLPLLSVHTVQSPLPDHTKWTVNCPFTLMPSLCYDIGSSNPEETRNQTSRACI